MVGGEKQQQQQHKIVCRNGNFLRSLQLDLATAAMTSEGEPVAMEQDDDPTRPSPRKGPLVTWHVDQFPLWYYGPDSTLTSRLFTLVDGTQWRLRLVKRTKHIGPWYSSQPHLEPVLVRDCANGPKRLLVGFQFSVVTGNGTYYLEERVGLAAARPVPAPLVTEGNNTGTKVAMFTRSSECGFGGEPALDPTEMGAGLLASGNAHLTLRCHLWRERPKVPVEKEIAIDHRMPKSTSALEHWLKVFPDQSSSSSSSKGDAPLSVPEPAEPRPNSSTVMLRYGVFREEDGPEREMSLSVVLQSPFPTMTVNRISLLGAVSGRLLRSSPLALHHFGRDQEAWSYPWGVAKRELVPAHARGKGVRVRYHAQMANSGHGPPTPVATRRVFRSARGKVGSTLSEDMHRFFSDFEQSCPGDMQLVSGDGQSFRAHLSLLCARSPVFLAMLERADMAEKRSRTVRIPDMGGAALGAFLDFVYCGEVLGEGLDCSLLAELYAAGDKYGLLSLKGRCSELLRRSVTLDNMCDVLEFSDLQCDAGLRGAAWRVFSGRPLDVVVSEEWRGLEERKRRLAEEAVEAARGKRMKAQ